MQSRAEQSTANTELVSSQVKHKLRRRLSWLHRAGECETNLKLFFEAQSGPDSCPLSRGAFPSKCLSGGDVGPFLLVSSMLNLFSAVRHQVWCEYCDVVTVTKWLHAINLRSSFDDFSTTDSSESIEVLSDLKYQNGMFSSCRSTTKICIWIFWYLLLTLMVTTICEVCVLILRPNSRMYKA